MAWSLRGSPKTVKITNKFAREWSELPEIREDRPLSERRLVVYRKTWEASAFRPVSWAKAWCAELEDWFRVNGKHTSTLFSNLDLSKGQDLYAVVEEYDCDTLEDVVHLYSTFDSNMQVRNQSDINKMFAASIPELKEFDSKTINLLVGGLSYWKFPGATGATNSATRTSADKAEVLFDEVEFCLWANRLLSEGGVKHCQHLRRVPVVGAIRSCWNKSKSAALEFWKAVRDETGERPDCPDRTLAKWLTIMKVKNGAHGDVPARYKVFPREFYVKCLLGWNAWRKGEKTNLKYYPGAKLPIAI